VVNVGAARPRPSPPITADSRALPALPRRPPRRAGRLPRQELERQGIVVPARTSPGRERRRRQGTRVGRMTAWRFVALLAASAACQERAQEVRSEAELKQTVDQMMPAVERATGLKFRRHPLVLRRQRTQVRDYVIHKFDSDLTARRARRRPGRLPAVRPIPDTLDLRRTMVDLLTEQIAGYYDPDPTRSTSPPTRSGEVRLIISHELVHRAPGPVPRPRFPHPAEAAERPPHRGAVHPRRPGHAVADPRPDAGAEAREPP